MIANGPAPYGGMLGGVFGFGAPPQQIRQETRRLSETEIDDFKFSSGSGVSDAMKLEPSTGGAKTQSINISRMLGENGHFASYSIAISSMVPGPFGPVLGVTTKTFMRQEPSAVALKNAPQGRDESGRFDTKQLPVTSCPSRWFTVTRYGDQLNEMANDFTPAYFAPMEFRGDSVAMGPQHDRRLLKTGGEGLPPVMQNIYDATPEVMPENEKFQFAAEIARGLLSADASPEAASRIMDQVGQAMANQATISKSGPFVGTAQHNGLRLGVNTDKDEWFATDGQSSRPQTEAEKGALAKDLQKLGLLRPE